MDNAQLQAGIIDNPGDVNPRLVYADWLEEQGDPRCEFIRSQIHRLDRSSDAFDAELLKPKEQEVQLLKKHRKAWAGSIAKIAPNHRFTRGFVESVSLGLKAFLEKHEAIFSAAPIRAVGLRQCDKNRIVGLSELPSMQQVSEVRMIKCSFTGKELATALANPNLQNVDVLLLGELRVDESLCRAIGESPLAPKLRALELGFLNAITPNSLDLPALLGRTEQLQYLSIDGNDVGEADIEAIAKLQSLRGLSIGGLQSEALVQQLLSSKRLTNLRWLGLGPCEFLAPLLAAKHLQIERLGIAHNHLSNESLLSLLDTKQLSDLSFLDLQYSRNLTSACIKGLIDSTAYGRLHCLKISLERKISKTAFKKMIASWQQQQIPGRKLCLPGLDLKKPDLKAIKDEFGKGSFVDMNVYPREWDSTEFTSELLIPGEEFCDVLEIWKRR